jgi:hypothetical protein
MQGHKRVCKKDNVKEVWEKEKRDRALSHRRGLLTVLSTEQWKKRESTSMQKSGSKYTNLRPGEGPITVQAWYGRGRRARKRRQ